jgi:hypothetical protein
VLYSPSKKDVRQTLAENPPRFGGNKKTRNLKGYGLAEKINMVYKFNLLYTTLGNLEEVGKYFSNLLNNL